MIDIVSFTTGFDMGVQDTIVPKAGNLLETQLGSLDYAPTFGVDLDYFLSSIFKFQNETFKAYLVERMINNQINVNEVVETIERFSETFTWDVGDASTQTGGLIR